MDSNLVPEDPETFYTLLGVRPDGVASIVDLVAAEDPLMARRRAQALLREHLSCDLVGAYPNYREAVKAWRARAQSTVDNALMRYFIIHAHRLLDPREDHEH